MATEPDWFSYLGTPAAAASAREPEDTSSVAVLRRAIRKAADDAAAAAPVGTAGGTGATPPDSASDEEAESGGDSGAESASDSGSSTAGIPMLDTPGNRKLLQAIAAKDKNKKAARQAFNMMSLMGAPASDTPRPVSLMDKYNAARRAYQPVPYPKAAADATDSSDAASGDTDQDSDSDDNRPTKPECFLCAWGDEFHDGIEAPLVTRLNGIFELYYGKAENAAIAQMMHLFYTRKIRTPGMPPLSQATALEHIEGLHTLDPRLAVGELIRRYMRFLAVLEDEVFFTNNGFSRHTMNAFNSGVRMVMALYKCDTTRMNFYNAKLDIDLKRMGEFTKVMQTFTQKKRQRAAAVPTRGHKRARDASGSEDTPGHKRPRRDPDVMDSMQTDGGVLAPPEDQVLI